MDVVAGQSYAVSFQTTAGIGHYSVDVTMPTASTDWGTVDFQERAGVSVANGSSYTITATRDGMLTVEALFAHGDGDVDLALRDAQGNLVADSSSVTDNERVDVVVHPC